MNMWVMIPVLLVLVFYIVLTWWQRRYRGSGKHGMVKDKPFLQEGTVALSTDETAVPAEVIWWQNLSNLHQLKLALHLAEKAIPVWEKFAACNHH